MLSKIIEAVYRLIVQPCMEEGESYAIRSRKLCSISVAVIAFNSFLLAVPFTYIAPVYDSSYVNYFVLALLYILVITCSIIPYSYVRYTKKLPDWVVELQMWTAMFCTSSLLLFAHQGSVTISATCAALMGLILRVRAWQLVLLCTVAFNVLHALINDFGDVLPKLHDTFYSNQLLSTRLLFLFGSAVFPFLLFGIGLHVIMMEFVQRSEQADAAIAMNLAVAAKLRRYDTDGVAEILAANKGKVDENLLEAFTAIQHNLQEYRPHIPDYIIAATTTEPAEGSLVELQADEDDEGNHSFTTSEYNSRYSSSSVAIFDTNTSRSGGGGNRSQCSDGMPSPATMHSITTGRVSPHHLDNHHRHRHNSHSTTETRALSPSEEASHIDVGAAKAYTGQATTVFIRFIAGACGSLRGTDGTVPRGSHTSTVVEYLGLGVEAAAKHAKLHGGAMQYMQGCGLMVSFNAASRVNAHESKACAFALALKAEMEALPTSTLTLHATIVTTPVMSFFAGNGGQLMLTVLGGYMPIHTALHHYLSQTVGDDVSCILISNTTLPSVEMHYEARMLGAVGMSSSSAHGDGGGWKPIRTIDIQADVFQLVCARKAKESDEWMYELENQNDVTHMLALRIVDEATNGDLKTAMQIISEHETAIHNDTLLSRCLHDRIESCIEDSTAFPLCTAPPTKMW